MSRAAESPDLPEPQRSETAPELVPVSRVLQFRGRRQILRLEPAFWNLLQTAARRRGIGLGELVHRLLDACGGGNFTAYVRVFCLAEAQGGASGPATGAGASILLRRALEAGPIPVLLLSSEGLVAWLNPAAEQLLGARALTLPGNRAEAVFRFHPSDLLARARVLPPDAPAPEGRIVHAAPGRLVTMKARVTPPLADGAQLIWLTVNPPARLPPADRA